MMTKLSFQWSCVFLLPLALAAQAFAAEPAILKPVAASTLNAAKKPAADEMPPADFVKFDGLSPEAAAKAITAPPGFSMKLFAGEPDVQQPIAFAIDDRGRLWVAEAYTYPQRAPEGKGRDRILIFEDTNGDGKFDRRTVFIEKLNLVSGLEVGFGGVWVGAAPYLMFIPDKNGDDQPDGEPQILLDGWAWQDTHETLNTFAWGPDGWLYGCHGVFTHSNVGKPGAPGTERTRLNAGVWRYHPTRHAFEVFAQGTSNPWGIDFDEYGQCLIEACVIPHLFHIIQGGRYDRQDGLLRHFNPHTFDDIKTIADHVHYAGNKGPHAGNSRSDSAGGGHAHAGLMVYLGGNWPAEYRGSVLMGNIHGQRLNMDALERKGSGYVGHHLPDFLNFNDQWSQVLNFLYDQDGSAYLIDWYDKNQCHHGNPDGHDRSNGRIFKLVYNDAKWTPVDLQKKSDVELVDLQLHPNDWFVRHARRILQERGPNPKVHEPLLKMLNGHPEVTRRLRALWALHVTGGLTEPIALQQLKNESEYIRAWSVQLLTEQQKPSAAALTEFAGLARRDPSTFVRLYLAAALQRTPVHQRVEVLEALLSHAEDATDHNLPLMYWYALEPVVSQDAKLGLSLMSKARIPRLRQFITRRMAATSKTASAGN
ncbi:MAG: PVC-type heme-binding CxxCH protein [Verrucomicrobiota bacterium]